MGIVTLKSAFKNTLFVVLVSIMIQFSSYAGTCHIGSMQTYTAPIQVRKLVKDVDTGLEGRHVVIIEDIVDTGLTLHYLQDILRRRGPRSLRTACLLSKPSRRKVDVVVDFIGFTIEDQFVVGYGLDYAEQYRNLPYIGVMGP